MQEHLVNIPAKEKRSFVSDSLQINSWSDIETYYQNLSDRKINSVQDLKTWMQNTSEVDTVMSEHLGWLYIRMTCNTQDKSLTEAYQFFVNEIQPKISPFDDLLNKKFESSEFKNQLDHRYDNFRKSVETGIALYREENIPLTAQMQTLEQKFGEIAGEMSIEYNGQTLTLQQASNHLRSTDREQRKNVYEKITSRRLQDRKVLDDLFSQLVKLRHQIANNAGFENFRDYKFKELERFDYTVNDCLNFHQSVSKVLVPMLDEIYSQRKSELKVDVLFPYDTEVDSQMCSDLKPFKNSEELISKTIKCFYDIDPYFGEVVEVLHAMKHVDLDSRIGKAPGGYNYPLYETGVPFIFMNSSGSLRDLVTMVHEGGHAIHSMLTRKMEHVSFKEFPSEVAELASMSMELISMEHWQHFFSDETDYKRARKEQLEGVLETLPWICCIDSYQHWIYTHPQHSTEERTKAWEKILSDFSSPVIEFTGYENVRATIWQKQLHLFEVPFYYIEYGMAQLGAVAMWKNYKTNPQQTVEQYIAALKLGYTKSIPEIYRTAGIRFDFSEAYIKELMEFVFSEYKKL